MNIAIACDHAGLDYKRRIKQHLLDAGHEVTDFGTESPQPCDYPAFIRPAAEAVAAGRCDRGIVLGGSGNGEAIVANRVAKVRCVLCWDLRSARLGRAHNDANVLSLGQRMISIEAALEIVDVFLATAFEGGRHGRRLAMIDQPPPAAPAE
ncbi:MAG: ribose 5-phosphate isomerase B [Planctomycetes bacterium]|nr:ribose 5-phosphate isomerase B [Planctomycetota bacterium]